MKSKIHRLIRTKYFPVVCAYVLLVIFKLLFILPLATGPISFGDEALYKKFSLQWFTLGKQLDTHYPPVYPLLLTVSFFFKNHWYTAMLVLNMLYSSLVPVFLYLIAGLYLDRRKSIYCMIVGCALPFHFIMPTMILSENVFLPILLLEIYLVLREYKKHPIAADVLIGCFLAVLCLSRYISIVTIPVFALVWLMKELHLGNRFVKLIPRGCVILAAMGLTYLPWIFINRGVPFKEIIGFGIASNTHAEQLTMGRLVFTAFLYICYFVLLALPVLPTLFHSFADLDYRKWTSRYNQIWVMIVGLTGAFFVAVTRHSWRVAYNWPDFARIMGRYLICFPVLYILLTFITWEKQKKALGANEQTPNGKKLVASIVLGILSAVFIVFSYVADISGVLYPGTSEQFLNFKGAMEGYKFVVLGVPYLILGLVIMLIIQFVRHTKWQKYSVLVLFIGVLVFELIGMDKYVDRMNRFRESKDSAAITEMNAMLTAEFPDSMLTLERVENPVPLYFDVSKDAVGYSWELRCMKFFCTYYYVDINKDFSEIEEGSTYYVVTETPEKYEASDIVKTLGSFDRNGVKNTLMLVVKSSDS